nr:reverse transcriptase domain-containing protein [Tanacetum cinerariifolium]
MGENRASWSNNLDGTWAFRTAFKTPIGCTPYKLVYEKACHLPIELEHKAYWALKYCNFDLKTANFLGKAQNPLDRTIHSGPCFLYGTIELSQADGPNFKYLNSDCSKHMTGARSQLTNFVNKFLGTIKFGNDHVAKIMGYGDYQIENVTISMVYFVEGLGRNLFFVGQFCDSDLEGDTMESSPICLFSKASKTTSWLWHRCLSHLNFGAINHLARQGLVHGLPKLKFEKDHLCSACAMGKSTNKSQKPKSEDTKQEKLYFLNMDLCGPMRVKSVTPPNWVTAEY